MWLRVGHRFRALHSCKFLRKQFVHETFTLGRNFNITHRHSIIQTWKKFIWTTCVAAQRNVPVSSKDQFMRIKKFVKDQPQMIDELNDKFALPYTNLQQFMDDLASGNLFLFRPTTSALCDFSILGEVHKPAIDISNVLQNKSEVEENVKLRNAETCEIDVVIDLYQRSQMISDEILKYNKFLSNCIENDSLKDVSSVFCNESDDQAKILYAKNIVTILSWIKKEIERIYLLKALNIPNKTHPKTHATDDIVLETVGRKPEFDYEVHDHIYIAHRLRILRQQRMANITGNRNYFLYGAGAELELALLQFAVDYLRQKSFTFISAPNVLKDAVFEGSGLVSGKMDSMLYKISNYGMGNFSLSGTSEIGLCAYFSSHAILEKDLPLKVCSVSTCYRKETASRYDAKGLFRVHQFLKVEMFGITANESGTESDELHQEFVSIQKELFEELGLHFKVIDMPVSDLGLPAYRKIDIEAWFPGRNQYGEISSASNCTDFQSRRLHILYKKNNEYKFAHTVNATACAIPRMIVALLENGQQANKQVSLPSCLHAYMGGKKFLSKEKHKAIEYIGPDQSKNCQVILT